MRHAYLSQRGRIVCSVRGCGFLIGVIRQVAESDGTVRRILATNEHLYAMHHTIGRRTAPLWA